MKKIILVLFLVTASTLISSCASDGCCSGYSSSSYSDGCCGSNSYGGIWY